MTLAAIKPEVRELPLAVIDEPTLPSRSSMDDEKMAELVLSMRTLGFISTIVVARHGDRYEVVAGHRRTIAARLAGLVGVFALIYPSKDLALEAIQHAENRHREDLNAADEAIWFAQLLEARPTEGTDGVAGRVGEGRDYVEGRLALLYGDSDIFAALAAGRIGIGVAQQLNRCDSALHRRNLLDQAIHNGATVATVSGWIAEYNRSLRPVFASVETQQTTNPGAEPILNDYFTCHLCQLKENASEMRPVQMHGYCVRAVLVPALEMFQRRSDYIRAARTLDEAIEQLNDLCDRFPALLTPPSPSA